jgi:signal transduction histidine kinase/ActR/RegA family two-component response regulator
MLEAADGAEALSMMRQEHVDLVISDIIMPNMNGLELVTAIRADQALAGVEVIFFTAAFLEKDARTLAKDAGVTTVLTKPCDPRIILNTVSLALGQQTVDTDVVKLKPDAELKMLQLNNVEVNRQFSILNARLASVLECTQHTMSERDPDRLCQNFCHVARNLVESQYCAVGILDEGGEKVVYYQTATVGGASANEEMDAPDAKQGVFSEIVSEHRCIKWSLLQKDVQELILPEHHPRVHSFLAVPVYSRQRTYGWIYCINKIEESTFTDTDARLLLSFASTLAIFWENLSLWQRLEDSVADLKRSNDDLQQFAYVCSHDLQEPLRVISNYTQLLAKRYQGALDKNADQFIEFIVEGARRMQQQINDLLLYSRVGLTGEAFANVDCAAAVDGAIANLKAAVEESDVKILVGHLPSLNCDVNQLRQVFQNLLGNAIKFRGDEPLEVDIIADDSGDAWTFTVRDNGIGFNMENAERIFVVFKRLHTKDAYPGSGVGLSICKKIVERHGGRIWVDSMLGRGSSFHFTLPKSVRAA